jgi:hypothetical protein
MKRVLILLSWSFAVLIWACIFKFCLYPLMNEMKPHHYKNLFIVYAVFAPFVYLYFQGRALERLLDTSDVDKWAFRFYVASTIAMAVFCFSE